MQGAIQTKSVFVDDEGGLFPIETMLKTNPKNSFWFKKGVLFIDKRRLLEQITFKIKLIYFVYLIFILYNKNN